MPLRLETVVVASADQVSRNLDDGAVILDLASSAYYGAEGVAQRIWELLQQPTALGDVVSALVDEYDVDRETCATDLLAFVSELVERKLVRVQE